MLDFAGAGGTYPGEFPTGDLTLSGDTLFGMTSEGGANGDGNVFSLTTTPTPEPSTFALLAAGSLGLLGYGRRRRWAAGRTTKPTIFDRLEEDGPAIPSLPSRSC